MKIHDISQTLRADIPVWPGEPEFKLLRGATITEVCPVNVGTIHTPLHAGTHADSPFHYDPHGLSSADSPLDPYIGPCTLIDVTHAGDRVEDVDLDWLALQDSTRVLLRTYGQFPVDTWDSSFKSIAPAVIARMREMGIKLIGTDAASLDPETSKTMDAHHEVRIGGMAILEGLVLNDVKPGLYELIALPLKIAGADASPVRAILREYIA
jgi:arylformamidase